MFSNKYYGAIPLMFFYLFTGIGKAIFSITFSFCYFLGYGVSVSTGFHFLNNKVCQPTSMNKKNKSKKHQRVNLCFQNKTTLKKLSTLPQCAKAV
jgi:hypothetical protein